MQYRLAPLGIKVAHKLQAGLNTCDRIWALEQISKITRIAKQAHVGLDPVRFDADRCHNAADILACFSLVVGATEDTIDNTPWSVKDLTKEWDDWGEPDREAAVGSFLKSLKNEGYLEEVKLSYDELMAEYGIGEWKEVTGRTHRPNIKIPTSSRISLQNGYLNYYLPDVILSCPTAKISIPSTFSQAEQKDWADEYALTHWLPKEKKVAPKDVTPIWTVGPWALSEENYYERQWYKDGKRDYTVVGSPNTAVRSRSNKALVYSPEASIPQGEIPTKPSWNGSVRKRLEQVDKVASRQLKYTVQESDYACLEEDKVDPEDTGYYNKNGRPMGRAKKPPTPPEVKKEVSQLRCDSDSPQSGEEQEVAITHTQILTLGQKEKEMAQNTETPGFLTIFNKATEEDARRGSTDALAEVAVTRGVASIIRRYPQAEVLPPLVLQAGVAFIIGNILLFPKLPAALRTSEVQDMGSALRAYFWRVLVTDSLNTIVDFVQDMMKD